ncbi:MAG: SDR family NAD(P)-dependent oxidoreductase [Flexibacteraceae bacterium]
MKIAVITGATSGIGAATAQLLLDSGQYKVIVCGRRAERLKLFTENEAYNGRVLALNFDVRNEGEVKTAIDSLPEDWRAIDFLLNNAGNAHGLSAFQDGDTADWDAMMDGNVKGLLYVSKYIVPFMIARRQGHIINISSIAGKETYANGAVYCASKAAVEAITKGMRIDLLPHNIKVGSIAPGMLNTEFSLVRFKGDSAKAESVYKGMDPLVADDIAELIWFMITRKSHINLADVLILPTAQAAATIVKRD